ncbi:MAG: hypothetical protein IKU63_09300, partial [Bacteroidaceae bacterium]|nr:hypothetical protein [Bacteroidaceae bacterium]
DDTHRVIAALRFLLLKQENRTHFRQNRQGLPLFWQCLPIFWQGLPVILQGVWISQIPLCVYAQ